MLAGCLLWIEEEDYYTNDFRKFYKDIEMTQELSEADLKMWAEWLNSPWSQTNENWLIECNCVNAYTPIDKSQPSFRCVYEVVGYDCITSKIIGYGYTQQEALQDCISHFNFLQKEYNAEDESY